MAPTLPLAISPAATNVFAFPLMKSFLSGRSRATTDSLQAPAGSNPGFLAKATVTGGAHKDHAAAAGGTGPTVEAVKQGDKVTRLIVTCSCGERIEIECLYPPGA